MLINECRSRYRPVKPQTFVARNFIAKLRLCFRFFSVFDFLHWKCYFNSEKARELSDTENIQLQFPAATIISVQVLNPYFESNTADT